ncbi:MAG: hypothetical protein B7X88_02885 [Polaromonas sp. 17-63-33]|nr:MAG: hypothetical protein B7Y60_10745 [Polaromonas sp. 35-63-35]OZA52873.1 MAG: hypothetical protein B7X88_02885 [Polaromonas sp. 17-63-33]
MPGRRKDRFVSHAHSSSRSKQGPRVWLCQPAGAAAPLGGRELHAVSDRGGISITVGAQCNALNRMRLGLAPSSPRRFFLSASYSW